MQMQVHADASVPVIAIERDEWSASSDRAFELMITGMLLGSVHVLTPDHLSALSALSVGGSWRSFSLGVRWSVGHSIGLLLCAAVFIFFKGNLDLHRLGQICDPVVGAFMVILGVFGVIGSVREHRYRTKKKSSPPAAAPGGPSPERGREKERGRERERASKRGAAADSSDSGSRGKSASRTVTTVAAAGERRLPDPDPTDASAHLHLNVEREEEEALGPADDDLHPLLHHTHTHTHTHAHALNEQGGGLPFRDIMRDPSTQRAVSVAMGLLHGIAGPGGILGVLPAVEMQHWQSSLLYLGSFMAASTLSMGVFAACYGEATRRIGSAGVSVEFGLRVFSSSTSIIVGRWCASAPAPV